MQKGGRLCSCRVSRSLPTLPIFPKIQFGYAMQKCTSSKRFFNCSNEIQSFKTIKVFIKLSTYLSCKHHLLHFKVWKMQKEQFNQVLNLPNLANKTECSVLDVIPDVKLSNIMKSMKKFDASFLWTKWNILLELEEGESKNTELIKGKWQIHKA